MMPWDGTAPGRTIHSRTCLILTETSTSSMKPPDTGCKFAVRRVSPNPGRPHGVEYSLTMHDSNNRRLVGFDNAHPVPGAKRSQRGAGRAYDHRHRLGTVKPYPYENAAKLVADFWEAVDEVLKLKGDRP